MSNASLLVVVVHIALAAALAARFGARWYFERSNAARRARGTDGILIGAEPVELQRDSEAGLLLLHGFGDTPQTMRELAHQLHGRGYAVSVPLLPGHGRTLSGFVRTTSSEWIAHADAAFQELRSRHRRVAIVGQSMGGALATILAARHGSVSSLVLVAPYISVPHMVRRVARMRHVVNHLLPYFPGLGRRSIHDEAASAQNLGYGALNAMILAELVAVVDTADAHLPALTMPVLMIQSREDNRIPMEAAQRIYERIGSKDKRLSWVTGCGHILTVDHCRDRVLADAIEWLNRHIPASSERAG